VSRPISLAETIREAATFLSPLTDKCGLVFITVPQWLVRFYTEDAKVVALGGIILMIAAFFQLFDGIQGVAIGALRGTGETRTAVLAHLISDWVIGLPVAWYFCFRRGWGAPGLWIGLSLAMILAGILLLIAWTRRLRKLTALKASRGW